MSQKEQAACVACLYSRIASASKGAHCKSVGRKRRRSRRRRGRRGDRNALETGGNCDSREVRRVVARSLQRRPPAPSNFELRGARHCLGDIHSASWHLADSAAGSGFAFGFGFGTTTVHRTLLKLEGEALSSPRPASGGKCPSLLRCDALVTSMCMCAPTAVS